MTPRPPPQHPSTSRLAVRNETHLSRLGNAETYFLVGDALGEAIKKLCTMAGKK